MVMESRGGLQSDAVEPFWISDVAEEVTQSD